MFSEEGETVALLRAFLLDRTAALQSLLNHSVLTVRLPDTLSQWVKCIIIIIEFSQYMNYVKVVWHVLLRYTVIFVLLNSEMLKCGTVFVNTTTTCCWWQNACIRTPILCLIKHAAYRFQSAAMLPWATLYVRPWKMVCCSWLVEPVDHWRRILRRAGKKLRLQQQQLQLQFHNASGRVCEWCRGKDM